VKRPDFPTQESPINNTLNNKSLRNEPIERKKVGKIGWNAYYSSTIMAALLPAMTRSLYAVWKWCVGDEFEVEVGSLLSPPDGELHLSLFISISKSKDSLT
jgi:hypothetical protein